MSVFKRKNKAGRPELPKDEKLSETISTNVKPSEMLRFEFARRGISKSQFARDLIIRGLNSLQEVKK